MKSPNESAARGEAGKRIVFLEPYDRGGLVHYTHEMANCVADEGFHVTVIGSVDFEIADADRRYLLEQSFRIDRSDRNVTGSGVFDRRVLRPARRLRSLGSFVRQYSKVARTLLSERPDFVVVGTIFRYPMMAVFVQLLTRRGIRVVQLCHEFQNRTGAGGRLTSVLMWSNRNAYQAFHRIFFLSDFLRSEFEVGHPTVAAERLKVMPVGNGQLFEELASDEGPETVLTRLGIPTNRPFVLFYGRLREDKGVIDLIEAFAEARKSGIAGGHDLVCLGDGPADLLKRMRELGDALGLGASLVIANGYYETSDLWAVVRSASVSAFPYRSGSQSAALQVALYAGRPIVASTAGGLSEVIQHGQNGLLSEPASISGLARNLEAVLNSEELATRVGAGASRSAVTTHGWSTVGQSFVSQLS